MKKLITVYFFLCFLTTILTAQIYDVYRINSEYGFNSVVNTSEGIQIDFILETYTDDPSGMRIFLYPYSNGELCQDCSTPVGFPLLTGSSYGVAANFTIDMGYGKIDEVMVRVTGDVVGDIKREFFIPVNINYGEDYPIVKDFALYGGNLGSRQFLVSENSLYMEFLYENVTDENRGYNVTAYPMTDGYPTPYLAVNGAKSESYSSTYDECVMNILGGNQIYVDSVLIIVEDFEEEKEYGRFMIPLGASFGQVRIDDVYFDNLANILDPEDIFQVAFEYSSKSNFTENFWITFEPTMGDSVLTGYSNNDPGLFSTMDDEGEAQFTFENSGVYADGFNLLIKNEIGDEVVGHYKFRHNDFRILYSDVDFKPINCSPVAGSKSLIGEKISASFEISSEEEMDVRVRMTAYSGNQPTPDTEASLSEIISLDGLLTTVEYMNVVVGSETNITHILWEVLDANTENVILTYMPEMNLNFFKADPAVSTESTQLEETSVKVYPNPSEGQFNIEFEDWGENAAIQIFNSLGQNVFSRNVQVGGERVFLNLDSLSPGIYHLNINGKERTASQKIIIQ